MVCGVSLGGCAGSSGSSASYARDTGLGGYDGSGAYQDNAATGSVGGTNSFTPVGGAAAKSAASQAADKLTAGAQPGNSSYMIGPLDVLDVSVFKVPDLAKTVQVSEDGTINYPLLGEVHAAGKTAKQLEKDMAGKLGGRYVRDPQVSVMIKEYNSQRVTIEGSVKTSGVYTIKGRTSLMSLMAMAGGVDDNTASGEVALFRTINGTRSAARFDTDAIKRGSMEDPILQPGDVIVVDTSSTKLAFQNLMKVIPLASTAIMFSAL